MPQSPPETWKQPEAELFRLLIENLRDYAVFVIDGGRRVRTWNPGAERLLGYREAEIIGQSADVFFTPEDVRDDEPEREMRVALQSGCANDDRWHIRKDGSRFWAGGVMVPLRDDAGDLRGFAKIMRDRTEWRVHEDQLADSEARKRAELAVVRALGAAANVSDGVGGALQAVCADLDWGVGLFWSVSDNGKALVFGQSSGKPGQPTTEFETESRLRTFVKGEGLPGRVWATGKAAWILDLARDDNFPRAAAAAKQKLHSAFASPIVIADEVRGVIEFFSTSPRRADTETAELMATIAGSVGQFLDRLEVQEKLRESEGRLRLALEAGHMGVWDWDIRTSEITWSDSLEPMHGLAPGSFGGGFSDFQKLVHREDQERVVAAIWQALEHGAGYNIEYRTIWPDGSMHWIAGKGKVFTSADGEPLRMIGIGMDVTPQKRSQQRAHFLADASATLAVLVDFQSTLQRVASLAVPDFADWVAIDLLESDGALRRVAVAHVNPAKVQLAHEVHRRFPPDPTKDEGVWRIISSGEPTLFSDISEQLLRRTVKDRELLNILRELGIRSYIGVPLRVRGKVLGAIAFIAAESGQRFDEADLAVAQDLADRAAIAIENAQLYRELRDADRRKDEFLATLAHELRNPLAPIRNALQLLRMPGASAAVADDARQMMERQLQQMVRLVDDLLDVSRITRNRLELRRERIEFAAVIQNAVETSRPLIDQGRHTLTVHLPPEAVYLDGDAVRLAQVFSNLLNNSAKYTEPGGKISLTAAVDDGQVAVRVADTGIGIPAESLPQVFEMFSQVERNLNRAQGGLGIGLTLVRRLVEMHGGSVEAHSAGPGQGSEFVVRLPTVAPATEEAAPRNEPAPAAEPAASSRVLVVDDNLDAAKSLAALLKMQGHEVRVAHDGRSALEVAAGFLPQFVLLDIGMPGMDGYEVARRLRTIPDLQRARLAALTGWGQPEDRRRSAEAGFDFHLVKPVEPQRLQELLESG